MATSEAGANVHENAKSLFCRMIGMGRDIEASMKVIALWLWLDSQGFQEIITNLCCRHDNFLDIVCDEGEAILLSLNNSYDSILSTNLMRITPTLTQRFLSANIILAVKEKVLKDITGIYSQVCCVLFKDILEERGIEVVSRGGEGKEEKIKHITATSTTATAPLNLSKCKLNPYAKEWNPITEKAPEEDRCLFLTFSNGYPLTESQITTFFTEKYGACVESVYVHWRDPIDRKKLPPLFGKVIFKASYVPFMVLNGQNEAKFWVDRKPLWCKRFDPWKNSCKNA